MRTITIVSGLFLTGIGILFLTHTLGEINSHLNALTGPYTIFS